MRTVSVDLAGREYQVYIGPAARDRLPAVLAELPGVNQVAVIADEHVAALHLSELMGNLDPSPTVLTVPPGEQSKCPEAAARLYDGLAEARIERGDLVITFGGGMIGDLGGFVAATWLRGIRFVQVPTTLEAAIDASVGGKTGLNHPAGKNLIGAFHQPSAVVIDTDLLATLPQRDYVAGLGESVKHAAIRDPAFLAWQESNAGAIVARGQDVLTELIARNCAIKAEVVVRDEREANLRAILNYGHTIGHAIEHLVEYELRHGECVAVGMIAANALASARGLLDRSVADRIRRLIDRLGLPRRLPRPVPAQDIIEVCRMDKKVRGGDIHFVLLRDLGVPERVADVGVDEIAAAVRTIQPA
jgi:3-dehydroquinate synthase